MTLRPVNYQGRSGRPRRGSLEQDRHTSLYRPAERSTMVLDALLEQVARLAVYPLWLLLARRWCPSTADLC
jgi:hypothetical protein